MLVFLLLLPGAGKESGGQAINLSTSYLELRRSKTLCGPECPADSSHVRNAFFSAGRCDANRRLPQDPKLGQQIPENIIVDLRAICGSLFVCGHPRTARDCPREAPQDCEHSAR